MYIELKQIVCYVNKIYNCCLKNVQLNIFVEDIQFFPVNVCITFCISFYCFLVDLHNDRKFTAYCNSLFRNFDLITYIIRSSRVKCT